MGVKKVGGPPSSPLHLSHDPPLISRARDDVTRTHETICRHVIITHSYSGSIHTCAEFILFRRHPKKRKNMGREMRVTIAAPHSLSLSYISWSILYHWKRVKKDGGLAEWVWMLCVQRWGGREGLLFSLEMDKKKSFLPPSYGPLYEAADICAVFDLELFFALPPPLNRMWYYRAVCIYNSNPSRTFICIPIL